ncbi:DUF4347 domain-containing protein [Rhodopirellula sp. JC740]|uniref:DUF4347 domain-containing protein n=1 Tax=Rhodopirellula halodulae TaxID=2894198 RepID=A0ABS8NBD2_9BACT|nr:DUF4347 domain-containing protein [Rhodopirellula sp. JC740]MCC9640859.1 DUF4347 domain-containing protein [Rhodopirellula sp. JC740]
MIRQFSRRKRSTAPRQSISTGHWNVETLEDRLMLAGDAGAEIAEAAQSSESPANDSPTEDSSGNQSTSAATCLTEIAFIDADVEATDSLQDVLRDGVEVVLLDHESPAIDQITRVLSSRTNIQSVHIVSHGESGSLMLAGERVNEDTLRANASQLAQWQRSLASGADILLYGCEAAAGVKGQRFVHTLADLTSADVAASTDATGHHGFQADWDLEFHAGQIDSSLMAVADRLQHIEMVLPITIRAAGTTGEEQMQLQINGEVVQTWNNIGGDVDSRQFQTFTYNGADDATASDVRVAFTNDLYEPEQGIDRNLVVDSITVNGVTVQSESSTTFGTGTWRESDGITPGFRESEWIHADGYFQYASPTTNTSISIYAAGAENTETLELWIDGQSAAVWENVGGNVETGEFVRLDFESDANIEISQIQLRFTNDLYVNDGEVDRNLRIDRLELNGQTYQTEAADVFSTGTWLNDELTPGFKQSEWLQSNGYFQFGAELNPGTISLATSNISIDEDAGTAEIRVVRTGGSDGVVTVDYDTFAGTATDGTDYTGQTGTLTFADGVTEQSILITIADDDAVETDETFNVTIDNVQGGELLAPRTATVAIIDNDVVLPNFADFSDVSGLTLNGSATVQSDTLELTPSTTNLAGSAFFNTAVNLTSDGSFRSSFAFQALGSEGTSGADGLTFTLHNDPRGAAALGASGGSLGLDGITPAVAVEFDTYRNPGEINDNHISILTNSVSNSLRSAIPDLDLNNGSIRYAWVDYNGSSDVLAVYLSDTDVQPTEALLKTTIDLTNVIGDSALVGFTAGTGGKTNSHRINQWTLDQTPPPLDPPIVGGDEVIGVTVASQFNRPTAIEWLPNGTMLVAQQDGVIHAVNNGVTNEDPFIDISAIVNGTRDRGLLDIAVHPDFANNPYVYLLFTYDPPEVANHANGSLGGPDGKGNRAGRLIRVTADAATDYQTVVADSEVVLLGKNSTWDNFEGTKNSTFDFTVAPAGEDANGNYLNDFINSDSESHTVGALAFGIDGELFVSIGDGASYNRVDVRADRVQHIDSLSGKVLRIDPITGKGLSNNPFYNGDPDANRSKVYQLGLRNPFRMSVDPVTGRLFVGDVGWTRWEEINSGDAGANFGWPFYEGASGTSVVQAGYAATAEGLAFFAQDIQVTASQYALNHQADGINAIVMGDVYRGSAYGSEYDGDVFFNDLGQGIVRHGDVDATGAITNVQTFTTGASVVVAISQGPDGSLYYVDLDDGLVGRWEIV